MACGLGTEARAAADLLHNRDQLRRQTSDDGDKKSKKKQSTKAKPAKAAAKPKSKKSGGSEFVDDEAMEEEEPSSSDDETELTATASDSTAAAGDEAAEAAADSDLPKEKSVSDLLDDYIALADARSEQLAAIERANGEEPNATRYTSQDLDFRRQTVHLFLKAMPGRKCENCKAQSPGFRKDGFTKIFKIPLTAKQEKLMEAANLSIPDIMADGDTGFTKKLTDQMSFKLSAEKAKKSAAKISKKGAAKEESDADDDDAAADADAEDDGAEEFKAVDTEAAEDEDDASASASTLSAAGSGSVIAASKGTKKQLSREAAELRKQTQLIFPNEVERHMQLLWAREQEILAYLYGQKRPAHEPVQV